MLIKVVLFGHLRSQLAREEKGRLTVSLPERSSLADLLAKLNVQTVVICSLNGQIERDLKAQLSDDDEVQIFQPIGGGLVF